MRTHIISSLLTTLVLTIASAVPLHAYSGNEGMTLLWKCDESGATGTFTQVVDATGHGNPGYR